MNGPGHNGSGSRPLLWGVYFGLLMVGLLIMAGKLRLDTEVLNLLPRAFPAVQGMAFYNHEFAQARELMFGLMAEGETDLDSVATLFAEETRQQPWAERVLSGDPLEDPRGRETLPELVGPLLFNLPPEEFAQAMESLEPSVLVPRLEALAQRLAAGSPAAEAALAVDPTGLAEHALAGLAQPGGPELGTMARRASDQLRLVFVVTNQRDLSAYASQDLMEEVNAFRASFANRHPEVRLLVTGRAPFVADISKSMRRDIQVTLLTSLVLVSLLFLFGFRRLRPLVAILLVLALCVAVSLAAGALIFGEINIITAGFCAILVGLGFDFGLLLCSIYQQALDRGHDRAEAIRQARQRVARGIYYGGFTTALAFLSLTASASPGFVQLGVLIAIGVGLCAVFLPLFLFLFLPARGRASDRDPVLAGCQVFATRIFRAPRPFAIAGILVAFGLGLILVLPPTGLRFQADPADLEPKESAASRDLAQISERLKSGPDPFLAVLDAADPAAFHEVWRQAHQRWTEAKAANVLSHFSTPLPFALLPERMADNLRQVRNPDVQRRELAASAETAGFELEALSLADRILEQMEELRINPAQAAEWGALLPEDSPWRFLTDRYLGETPGTGVAYLTPTTPLQTVEDRQSTADAVAVEQSGLIFTGWSYMLLDLIPWAKKELVLLSGAIAGLIMLILALIHRRLDIWLIQVATLGLALAGLGGTLKLLDIPLTLSNVLAFPLIIGVGVDYGIHTLLAARQTRERIMATASVLKPVLLGGLTTFCGFGSLTLAHNPALSGLGQVCAVGVAWCLLANFFILLPLLAWRIKSDPLAF